jgi:hypothetical protein
MSQLTILLVALVILVSNANGVTTLAPSETFSSSFTPVDAVFTKDNQLVFLGESLDATSKSRHYDLYQWNIPQRVWVRQAPVGLEGTRSAFRSCTGLAYVPAANMVVVCSGRHSLTFVDADTLSADHSFELHEGEELYDFAIDERFRSLYVILKNTQGRLLLREYRVGGGATLQETDLPGSSPYNLGSLTISPDGKTVTAARNVYHASSTSGELLLCALQDKILCKMISVNIGVGGTAFAADDTLLLASSTFADRRRKSLTRCIQSVSVSKSVVDSNAYCRPSFGVHYSVATVNDLVIGYSGYATYHWLSENINALVGRISVWRKDSKDLIATTNLPESSNVQQISVRIVGDTTSGKNRFLVFNGVGGMPQLLIYDVN